MKRLLIISIYLLGINALFGQSDTGSRKIAVSLNEYLARVANSNLDYAAEQFNVGIAEAQLKAAKIFADPEVSVAYSNNEDRKMMMGQGVDVGISYPFSLGNKRGAAVSLAKSGRDQAQTALDAYFQSLRADAAILYFSALKQDKLHQLQLDIYSRMRKLAETDSIRLKAGEINATDALQTAVEARSQQNDVFQSEADMTVLLVQLSQLLGSSQPELMPAGDFPAGKKDFNLQELIQKAQSARADLQLAIRNKEISEKQLAVLKANRAFEFSLDAGYSHSTVVKNEIAPAPAFNTYSAGITIPLKFSSFNKGEIQAARLAVQQTETTLRSVQLQIASEVTQAYATFKAAAKKLEQYNLGLTADAGKIVQARTYAYQRGETGLIDLLNAQHTYADLQVAYCETLFQYAEALILLEKSAGIWDF